MSVAEHIRLDGVQKCFKRRGRKVPALDGVDLLIKPGARLGVVGESGSGKSTLARLLAGLETPTRGQIRIDGVVVGQDPLSRTLSFRHKVQMVFQNPFDALNPRLTIRQSLAEPLERLKLPRGALENRLLSCLERVDLADGQRYLDRRPFELSGGQLQRVVMARALLPEPDILIGDEPVSMLDVSARARILNLFKTLSANRTCLLISHDLALIGYVCDRVVVLYRGRVVEDGPARAILAAPRHPYTAALIAATPRPRFDQPRVGLPLGPEAAVEPAELGCAFRPRCPASRPACAETAPALRDGVACHFPLSLHQPG